MENGQRNFVLTLIIEYTGKQEGFEMHPIKQKVVTEALFAHYAYDNLRIRHLEEARAVTRCISEVIERSLSEIRKEFGQSSMPKVVSHATLSW